MPDIAKEYWKMDKVLARHSLCHFCTMLFCMSCGALKVGEMVLGIIPSRCLTCPCLLHDE